MKLTIVIEPDGDGYHAKVPALPGCGTWAETEAQARKQIKEAIQLYLKPTECVMREIEDRRAC